jgi:hypothetical protein
MSPESNALASQNGIKMENIIKALYPGVRFEYQGLIDLSINGVRVEIKSCQEYVTDNSVKSTLRSGRFCFFDIQHETLIENAGEYIFLVQREGIPLIYVRVPAQKIKLGKFTGVKSLCWKTIIQGAV